ncbi:hypothetical protein D3C72_2158260 [compost metagenome]
MKKRSLFEVVCVSIVHQRTRKHFVRKASHQPSSSIDGLRFSPDRLESSRSGNLLRIVLALCLKTPLGIESSIPRSVGVDCDPLQSRRDLSRSEFCLHSMRLRKVVELFRFGGSSMDFQRWN